MKSPRLLARRCAMGGSALLLVLTCLAWAHSVRFRDIASHWRELDLPPQQRLVPGHAQWRNVTIELDHGEVYVEHAIYAYGTAPVPGFQWNSTPNMWEIFGCSPAAPDMKVAAAGFSFAKWNRFPEWRKVEVHVPLWSIASMSGAWPLFGLITVVRRRRAYGEGRCTGCGYDLRATPHRCPECGLVPSGKPS